MTKAETGSRSFLTLEELAERLGVPESELAAMVARRLLAVVQTESGWRVPWG